MNESQPKIAIAMVEQPKESGGHAPHRKKSSGHRNKRRDRPHRDRPRRPTKKKTEMCAYCGHREATTIEHFIPQSSKLDIAFKKINLIPACDPCNKFKGGRWPNEKEIAWFFTYWRKQLSDIESHLKIADALKRNEHGRIEDGRPKHSGPRRHRRR